MLVGKPLVALPIVWAMRYPLKVALTVAIALAQIGEFSFILSTIGQGARHPDDRGDEHARGGLHRLDRPQPTVLPCHRAGRSDGLLQAAALAHAESRGAFAGRRGGVERHPAHDPAHRAVVIGYGPTGRTVVRLLRENQIAPTVVELNMESVSALQQEGLGAVYGDATQV